MKALIAIIVSVLINVNCYAEITVTEQQGEEYSDFYNMLIQSSWEDALKYVGNEFPSFFYIIRLSELKKLPNNYSLHSVTSKAAFYEENIILNYHSVDLPPNLLELKGIKEYVQIVKGEMNSDDYIQRWLKFYPNGKYIRNYFSLDGDFLFSVKPTIVSNIKLKR